MTSQEKVAGRRHCATVNLRSALHDRFGVLSEAHGRALADIFGAAVVLLNRRALACEPETYDLLARSEEAAVAAEIVVPMAVRRGCAHVGFDELIA